jgi:hypothetical protein
MAPGMSSERVAISMGTGPRLRLNSGAWFDLLAPETSDFTIEDIAHGLAHTCRYAGQSTGFYSVAEHSLLVSAKAEGHALEGLMHDAAEAFLGDVTRPLKQLLPDYRRIEKSVDIAICARFGIPSGTPRVKKADLEVLAAEQDQLMPEGTSDWVTDTEIEPAQILIECLPPAVAKARFLQRYHELVASAAGTPR